MKYGNDAEGCCAADVENFALETTDMKNSLFPILSAVFVASALAGCGGGGGGPAASKTSNSADSRAAVEDTAESSTAMSQVSSDALFASSAAPSRRGIQSIYWLGLNSKFQTSICQKLNAASAGPIEIEFCPASKYTNGQGWSNATSAITKISGHSLYLAVDFGHHVVEDITPQKWGEAFYDGIFSGNYSRAKFVVQLANEDNYSDTDWKTNVRTLLGAVRDKWTKDKSKAGKAFPYGQIIVRRTPMHSFTMPATFTIKDNETTKFNTESEYHFPEDADVKASSANVISNDGQLVINRTDYKATKGNVPLRRVPLTTLTDLKTSHTLLLWHPVLHGWKYTAATSTYSSDVREFVEDDRSFLSLLEAFLKNAV